MPTGKQNKEKVPKSDCSTHPPEKGDLTMTKGQWVGTANWLIHMSGQLKAFQPFIPHMC